ncbi:MAG: hypothetical protein AB1505_32990, partial [Candidatus Latescibacterota bacterium]
MATRRSLCRAATALLLSLAAPAAAHNGALALAYPVQGVAVDGDLSDWPHDLPRYPVALTELGDRPRSAADHDASFRIGYHAADGALYLALEASDQSTVIDPVPTPAGWADWRQEDG